MNPALCSSVTSTAVDLRRSIERVVQLDVVRARDAEGETRARVFERPHDEVRSAQFHEVCLKRFHNPFSRPNPAAVPGSETGPEVRPFQPHAFRHPVREGHDGDVGIDLRAAREQAAVGDEEPRRRRARGPRRRSPSRPRWRPSGIRPSGARSRSSPCRASGTRQESGRQSAARRPPRERTSARPARARAWRRRRRRCAPTPAWPARANGARHR